MHLHLPSFLLKPYSLWIETCRNRVLKSTVLCPSLALALPSPVLFPVDSCVQTWKGSVNQSGKVHLPVGLTVEGRRGQPV